MNDLRINLKPNASQNPLFEEKKRNDHRNKIKILLIIIIFCWESSWSNIQQCSNAMIKKKTVPIALTPANITKLKNITKLTKCRCKKTKKWSKNKLSFDFNEKTDIKSSIKMWMQWDIRKIISVAVWSENMKKRTLSKIRKAVGKVPAIQMSFW